MTLNPGPHRVGLACLGLLSGPAFIPADVILLKRLWLTYIRKKTIILRAVEATGCLNYGIIVIGIIDIIDSPSFTCSFKLYLYINFIAHRALWVRIYSHFISLHFAIGEDICSRSYIIRFPCQSELMTAFFRISKGGYTFQGVKDPSPHSQRWFRDVLGGVISLSSY